MLNHRSSPFPRPIRRSVSARLKQQSIFAVAFMLGVLLSGCGFTLRGSADLPAQLRTLQVESPDPNSAIMREVRNSLRDNGVDIVDSGAPYQLGVGSEQNSERALSVNANARAGEYELTMSVPFQLRRGADLVAGPITLSVERIYLADPENAVAKNEEAELIRTEMRRELAQQALRRLQALEL
ncbi:MAG: hypothetical protein RLZZ227_1245 [Pseudomonadota bacterium]|jgi:LPS-assembly lipoprotein